MASTLSLEYLLSFSLLVMLGDTTAWRSAVMFMMKNLCPFSHVRRSDHRLVGLGGDISSTFSLYPRGTRIPNEFSKRRELQQSHVLHACHIHTTNYGITILPNVVSMFSLLPVSRGYRGCKSDGRHSFVFAM